MSLRKAHSTYSTDLGSLAWPEPSGNNLTMPDVGELCPDAARAKVTCPEPANYNWGNSGYGWFLAQWFRQLAIVGSTTSFKYRESMDFPH